LISPALKFTFFAFHTRQRSRRRNDFAFPSTQLSMHTSWRAAGEWSGCEITENHRLLCSIAGVDLPCNLSPVDLGKLWRYRFASIAAHQGDFRRGVPSTSRRREKKFVSSFLVRLRRRRRGKKFPRTKLNNENSFSIKRECRLLGRCVIKGMTGRRRRRTKSFCSFNNSRASRTRLPHPRLPDSWRSERQKRFANCRRRPFHG
jgi:hypothetical protein